MLASRLRFHLSEASLGLASGLILLFIVTPIAVVVLFSFNSANRLTLPIDGLSLRWYREILSDPVFRASMTNSLIVGLVAAGCTAVLGTLASFALTSVAPRWRGVLSLLFFAPITLPGLFLGLALLTFFARLNVELSLMTVIAAHFVYTFPYFVLIARAALERLDPQLGEMASDLGASGLQSFRRVTFPIVRPVLIAATVLAFALSFDEFIITFFVIGPESTTPLVVYSSMRRSIDPSINALASMLLLVTVVGTLLTVTLVGTRRWTRKAVTRS